MQISLLAGLGGMNVAIVRCIMCLDRIQILAYDRQINPAYGPIAKELGISVVTASYQTTITIAINGVAPFFFIPLANTYGRRPLYLACTLCVTPCEETLPSVRFTDSKTLLVQSWFRY